VAILWCMLLMVSKEGRNNTYFLWQEEEESYMVHVDDRK